MAIRPTILTATGLQKTAVFAGVLVQDSTPYLMKYHLATTFQDDIIDTPPQEPTSIQYWQNWAVNNNYILRWGALYGNAAQPLYAGIWEQNSDNAGWNWFSAFYESSDLFQQPLQAEAEQWVCPAFIALSPDQHVWSIFQDDVIGPCHQLIERGLLTLNTPIQQVLKLRTPDGRPPPDPRFNDILVWHLLSRAGGWNRRIAPDPLFNDAAIAQALHVPLPINKYQMTAYMAGQPLQFAPGTRAVYSNFGYSLLGQIVEKILGLDYESAVQQHIYTPLSLKRPRLAGSLLSQQAPGEVRYHGQYPYIAQSVMSPDQPIVPEPYGGSNEQLGDSLGGQIMAACDYARMLASFDLGEDNPLLSPNTVKIMWTEPLARSSFLRGWFRGTLANGLTAIGHNSGDIGTTTMGFRRPDNISFVVFFNHDYGESLYLDGTVNMLGNALSDMADTISNWPDNDLFPSVDISVFIHLTIPYYKVYLI